MDSIRETPSSTSPPTSSTAPTPSTSNSQTESLTRGKTDPAWSHCREDFLSNKKVKCLICLHCGKKIRGGVINRLKQHLVGIKGETAPCPNVGANIRFQMLENLKAVESKKKGLKECLRGDDFYGLNLRNHEEQVYMQDEDDIQEIQPPPIAEASKGKKNC